MEKDRCRLEGERYIGRFEALLKKRKSGRGIGYDRHEYWVDFWEGDGEVIDKEDDNTEKFKFFTYGHPRCCEVCDSHIYGLEREIVSFDRDHTDEEVKIIRRKEVVDKVLERIYEEVRESDEIIPRIRVKELKAGKLIEEGLVAGEQGQIMLGLKGSTEKMEDKGRREEEEYYRVVRNEGDTSEKARELMGRDIRMTRRSYVYWFLLDRCGEEPISRTELKRLFRGYPKLNMQAVSRGQAKFCPTFQDNIDDLVENLCLESVEE